MSAEKPTCSECRYFRIDGIGNARCHHGPPVIVTTRVGGIRSTWPETHPEADCGEYEPPVNVERLSELLARYGVDPQAKPKVPPPRNGFYIRAEDMMGGPTLGTCPPARSAGPVPKTARTCLDPPREARWSEARAPAC